MAYFQTPSGHRIYYEHYGETGPALVLAHGLASSSRIWVRQVKALQQHFRVYVFDFPGHGKSDRWPAYSFGSFADIMGLWLDHCGLEKVNLVGLSLGCSVALTFAARHPERIESMVLEGPVGGYHAWWNPLGWADWTVFSLFPVALHVSVRLFGHHATTHWLNTFGVKKKRSIKALESVQNMVDARAVRQLLWQSSCPPYVGKLDRIQNEVLMVRGCNDPMPRRFVRYIQTHLKQAFLVEVPGARHLVAMERPRMFNSLVLDFINGSPEDFRRTVREKFAFNASRAGE